MLSSENASCQLVEYQAYEIQLPDCGISTDHKIGRGTTAWVYKIHLRVELVDIVPVCRRVALKRFLKLNDGFTDEELQSNLKREAEVLRNLSHPNIVNFIGVCYEKPFIGLLMTHCEGSSLREVRSNIPSGTVLSTSPLIHWAKQIADGMEYVTKQGYIHRDLRSDNILVLEKPCYCVDTSSFSKKCSCRNTPIGNLRLMIGDFGDARKVEEAVDAAGSYAYIAPEAFQCGRWSEAADVWSFGVVLWEIITGEYPAKNKTAMEVAQDAFVGKLLPVDQHPFDSKWKDIMLGCWSLIPEHRPTFHELANEFRVYSKKRSSLTKFIEFKSTELEVLHKAIELNSGKLLPLKTTQGHKGRFMRSVFGTKKYVMDDQRSSQKEPVQLTKYEKFF
ncbi:Protein CBG08594 [Caenorhabditis briggsae]|uniref:Protein CBG08594 n=2 Tax=Caenorhabditis briggsae TaxID=6238 RepID=A8X717_CAEBR|nr:Protein CBG08594 [Caenorhabditis briggsae]ULT88561.1 hypothetical protein L3Y34_007635 [Caenorhabditis briggsae]CAP28428.1 Protein CBG08594 [Caenorhabditis briggsae]